jgi:hypothetical protein
MIHIRNSKPDSIFLLEHEGIPTTLLTDFNETIIDGSLCIDITNQDIYQLKNGIWTLIGGNSIPAPTKRILNANTYITSGLPSGATFDTNSSKFYVYESTYEVKVSFQLFIILLGSPLNQDMVFDFPSNLFPLADKDFDTACLIKNFPTTKAFSVQKFQTNLIFPFNSTEYNTITNTNVICYGTFSYIKQ